LTSSTDFAILATLIQSLIFCVVFHTAAAVAIDISSRMLSIPKQRASSFGLQDVIEFKQRDAETIDLPTSTFDAVLCRWGMTLFLDFDTGLSNIYRYIVRRE
jgi:ubiquinone/menaquinone biosynthesis C-methylase UbiE